MWRSKMLIGTMCICLLLGGCSWLWPGKKVDSGSKKEGEQAKEIRPEKHANISDEPEPELLKDAKRQYAEGLFSVARESFEAVRDQYPLGAYAEFAEIKAADSYFESGDYSTAGMLYEEFMKNRPSSPSLPYALLRAGRSYQMAQRGIGRDETAAEKSRNLYKQLIERFPDSIYAESAKAYRTEVEKNLATHEKMVIDFYRKMGKKAAWEAREREFEEHWGHKSGEIKSAGAGPALEDRVRKIDQTRVAALPAAFEENFDENIGGQETLGEVTSSSSSHRVTPHGEKKAGDVSLGLRPGLRETSPPSGKVLLRAAECHSATKTIFFFLDRELKDRTFLNQSRKLVPEQGVFAVRVPDMEPASRRGIKQDCFGEKDLTVNADGTISIGSQSFREARLFDIGNPPRLVMALK